MMNRHADPATDAESSCTCPSGDGSLRWPCPTHPNANYSAVRRTIFVQATSGPDYIRPDLGNRRFWAIDLADTSTAADAEAELPHYDDIAIDHFARVMKLKMETSRAKGRRGWDDPEQCSIESLQAMLFDHVAKGDPVDVANFCMMLWIRDGKTNMAPQLYTQPEEHFAWAAFAENGNVIIWSRRRAEVEPVAAKYGRPVVPVIALATARVPPMAVQPGTGVSAAQALIALGKYATGYRLGQEGWAPEDDAALHAAVGSSPGAADAGDVVLRNDGREPDWEAHGKAENEAIDAARWREALLHVGGEIRGGRPRFTLNYFQPVPGARIMQGSIAGHFTDAIDAALARGAAAKNAADHCKGPDDFGSRTGNTVSSHENS